MPSPSRLHVGAWVFERRANLRWPMLVVDHDEALEVFVVAYTVAPDWIVKTQVFAASELDLSPHRGPNRIQMRALKTGGM